MHCGGKAVAVVQDISPSVTAVHHLEWKRHLLHKSLFNDKVIALHIVTFICTVMHLQTGDSEDGRHHLQASNWRQWGRQGGTGN